MAKRRKDISADATVAILDHWRRIAPDDRLAHLVRHASRGLRRSLELRLARHDLTFGQWSFLRILWLEDGLSQRELSARAGLTEPTTHSAVTRMEALGLIERRGAAPGRKRLRVHLTDRGRALETVLTSLAEDVNRVALRGAPEGEAERIRGALLLMVRNLAEDEADALAQGLRIPPTRRRAGAPEA